MAVTPLSKAASVLAWDKSTQPAAKQSSPKTNRGLIIAGLIAALLLIGTGLWRSSHTPSARPVVTVVAAGQDLAAGVKLGFTSLHYLEIPKSFATKDMITSYDTAAGCVTRTFLPAGEPIRANMLLPKNTGLSSNLENDERAITLDLSSDAIVDHAILPDDLVDVLAITTNKDGKKYTKTIGQSVRVLVSVPKEQCLARNLTNNSGKGITLAVAPYLAESITEASEVGKIRLVLRNRLSRISHNLFGSGPNDLLPAAAQDAVPKATPLPDIALEAVAAPPPSAMPPVLPESDKITQPLQWLVEIVSGSHKETYGVPER